MGFFYFDDSKHPGDGFILGAFVYVEEDPSAWIEAALRAGGLRPGIDEFKSGSRMDRHPEQKAVRQELKYLMGRKVKLGVLVAQEVAEFRAGALQLLVQLTQHHRIGLVQHSAYFDRDVFGSVVRAQAMAQARNVGPEFKLHFEQDSIAIPGIQLADLAAHTCSTMLREALGVFPKRVRSADEDGWDGAEISIGFDLWSNIRYCMLVNGIVGDIDDATYDSEASLLVTPGVRNDLRTAALGRFGRTYLGCIH